MSVKILSKKDLTRKARSRRGTTKAQRLGMRAQKLLNPGDLVEYNGYEGYNCTPNLEEGIYGLLIKVENDICHVLCGNGIVQIAKQGLDRVQEFNTFDRQQRCGIDVDAKKL